jgi:hypothetical protein
MKNFIILSALLLQAVILQAQTNLHSNGYENRMNRFGKIVNVEKVALNDTIYLHINFKFFHKRVQDTSIIFTQNWNFAFCEGNRVEYKGDSLLYIYAKGREFPENLITFAHQEDYGAHCYPLTGEDWVKGNNNNLCISSHFRKLCDKDTLNVDFWTSDKKVISRYLDTDEIRVRIFTSLHNENIPDSVWRKVPLYTKKDLYIYIKNPAPCIKNKCYLGHTYEQIATPTDCEKKYKADRWSWWR